MGFKENLKAELSFQDMLVKELAARTGISKRTLDNYLRTNACDPPASTAVKIAQTLGVSVEYLVTGRDRDEPVPPDQSDVRFITEETQKLLPKERLIVLDLINSLRIHFH